MYQAESVFRVRISDDREMTTAFLEWCLAAGVRSIDSGGVSGTGCVGFFKMADRERIERWLSGFERYRGKEPVEVKPMRKRISR